MTAVVETHPTRTINSRRVFTEALVVAVFLTALSYLVGRIAGWLPSPDLWTGLEAFAVFTSYACTYMCVKESRFNYPIGAVSTATYSLLFFHYDLVASAILNAYLTPALIYGWFRWRSDNETRHVQHVALKWVPVYILVTGFAYIGALVVARALGGDLAITDSLILIGTMLAQFLLDNKKIETWLVWITVNIAAIYTYFNADLHLAGFQYIFFLLNAFLGYYIWKKNLVPSEVTA